MTRGDGPQNPVEATLRLQFLAEGLQGSVDSEGSERFFSGWMGLLDAIERLRPSGRGTSTER